MTFTAEEKVLLLHGLLLLETYLHDGGYRDDERKTKELADRIQQSETS
jgi:hypothetical protein